MNKRCTYEFEGYVPDGDGRCVGVEGHWPTTPHCYSQKLAQADKVEPFDECTICGADIGPSSVFPWHYAEEDCRAIRDPHEPRTGTEPPDSEQYMAERRGAGE